MHPQHKHRQTVLPKKITRSIVAVVLALGLLVAGILPAFAESAINVNIPVREQGIGGMVLLEAEDGSSQQSASVGSYASANFALTYSEPGTYTYTIHQSSVYDGAIKDDTSYHVYVVIQSSDSGLSSAVVAVKTGDTKSQDIVFNNTKKDQKSETPKPNQPKPDQPKPLCSQTMTRILIRIPDIPVTLRIFVCGQPWLLASRQYGAVFFLSIRKGRISERGLL